jgi:ElaB/YqjD/DUF883 family membrane-anchored ribosome-binding protein
VAARRVRPDDAWFAGAPVPPATGLLKGNVMSDFISGNLGQGNPNVVDRAAQAADKALDATRRAADATIDRVAEGVHGLRDRASPMVDNMTLPYDSVVQYTRQEPIKALLAAAAAGAVLMALLSLMGRSHR